MWIRYNNWYNGNRIKQPRQKHGYKYVVVVNKTFVKKKEKYLVDKAAAGIVSVNTRGVSYIEQRCSATIIMRRYYLVRCESTYQVKCKPLYYTIIACNVFQKRVFFLWISQNMERVNYVWILTDIWWSN